MSLQQSKEGFRRLSDSGLIDKLDAKDNQPTLSKVLNYSTILQRAIFLLISKFQLDDNNDENDGTGNKFKSRSNLATLPVHSLICVNVTACTIYRRLILIK